MSPTLRQPPKKEPDTSQKEMDFTPLDLARRDVVWIDFETGGTRCRYHSPLSFAMLWTRGMNVMGEWTTQIREEPLVVCREAMKVTGIDLREPGLDFITFRKEYFARINEWFYTDREGKWVKATRHNMPLFGGQNIAFDRPWLQWILHNHLPAPLKYEKSWDGLYYHGLDLMRLAVTLARMGLFKPHPDMKLRSICEQLGVPEPPEGSHDALGDVKQTFWAYWVMEDLLRRHLPALPYNQCLGCRPWKRCPEHQVQLPPLSPPPHPSEEHVQHVEELKKEWN